jgi:hypothetical protein
MWTMMLRRLLACGGLAALVTSCGGAEAKPAGGGVVDRVVPRDTAIARFQRALPRVASFDGGAGNRDRLVRRFVAALEKRDTAILRSLLLTRSEFGWLYYPTHPEGLPPYNLTPQLMWFMHEGHNEQGYRKLLQKRSGRPLRVLGYRCEGEPAQQAENTVWGPCVVLRRTERGDTLAERLFGLIIGRGGSYKFVSYANKL